MQAINEGLAILQDRQYSRILINLIAAKMHISRPDKVRLAGFIAHQHAINQVKTAFLIRCEQTERAEADEGLVGSDEFNSCVFFSRRKAITWLAK